MTSVTSITTSTTSQYTVAPGTELLVANGGNISAAAVTSGGLLVVSGGVEAGATVSSGGKEVVSTGSASGDLIYGVLSTVSPSAAYLANETIENGGVFYEYNSATVSNTTVSSGGTFILSGNTSGVNVNTTVISGGLVELITAKSTIGGTITFSGGNNVLETSAGISAGYGDEAVITGFGATDRVEVATIGYTGATLSVTTSGSNSIATVTSAGVSEAFIFAGTTTYTSNTLSLTADTSGHVEIAYVSAATGGVTTSVTTSTASGAYAETSGNTLLVLGGGSVSAATISAGGSLVVNGGVDYAAGILSGGAETVSTGSATGDTIAGSATVDIGASVGGEAVSSGGVLTIASGGVDSGATVSAGGSLVVSSGGSATADVVFGTMTVISNGVVVTGETVEAGGLLNISKSATVTNLTLSGGVVNLLTPAATLAGSVTFAAGAGAILKVTSVSSAGTGDQAVISGFDTSDTIDVVALAATGASLSVVASGGNDVATLANGASSESFIFAGTSTYTGFTLQLGADGAGHAEIVYNPNAVVLTVASGVTSTGVNITSGETLTVLSGGVVSGTTVQGAGTLVVSGLDHAATISALGVETVTGSASGDQIAGAATIIGAAKGETVLSGGALLVNGGAESGATVSAGGTITLLSGTLGSDQIDGAATLDGGVASAETVSSGGYLTVSGGVDSGTTLLAGGNELVLGSASGDQIHGVQLVSAATAVVTSETVFAGGDLNLFLKGAVASAITVSSGGALNISGNATANNVVLSGGGVLTLESPKTQVTGVLTFAGGGNTLEITGTTSAGYGFTRGIGGDGLTTVLSGFSSTDEIDIAPTAFDGSALTLSQTISAGNTVVDVLSGGVAVETFTFAGTTQDGFFALLSDNAGGVALEAPPVSQTTSVTTSTAPGAYSETATNTLLVLNGGSVSGATISSGGFLQVAGGVDAGATVLAGGTETLTTGSVSGDQIYGSLLINGGVTEGETALGGGQISVGAGATGNNVILGGGGVVDLADATASLTGSVTFTSGGNTLVASANAASGAGDLAVINGFSTADRIDIAGIAPTGASLTFSTDGAGHSIATVSGTGGSESFVFNSPAAYNAASMSLYADGTGGVNLVLDTTPVVTLTSFGGQTNTPTTLVNGTVDTTVDPEAIGTTVQVTENGSVVGTATVGADGRWTAKVTFQNDSGANVLSATDTDLAGNTGVAAQPLTYSVDTTAAAFTPGNLVLSIVGSADGSGLYSLDQATAITLEQITTTGSVVGQLVLPQTTTVVNGVTEYQISGEYGSASEGSLQLSGDGHSLVIAGYDVNAQAFDASNAPGIYGTNALGQTTSIAVAGGYTPVPRVVADINANGVVDTSTALYGVFNTNNPRSVATIDGSTFWLSGQGVKGDNTQGVFVAADGASTATAIYNATDTRTAEIFNGQLYVSVDSTQGATTIENYGGLPSGQTTPTYLQGLNTSVTVTAATSNGINSAGQTVNLSPENFFFANANTLYVADAGLPKLGGVGDGGLQKWVFNGTSWTLQYTLSAGLNLVSNSAASGTTGLIGLTGKVVGDSVQLYATNETVSELGQTYVYSITDSLSSTTGAGETFTPIVTASPGEIIRGISFAPTAYAPTITGAVAGQTTTADAAVSPFAHVTIADPNTQATETLTITLSGPGALTGTGLTGGAGGVYTLSGTASAVTGELDALSFTPAGTADASATTTFTLSDLSSADATPTVDSTTTVIDTDPPLAPSLTAVVGTPVNGSTVEVTGTGAAGDTIKLYADGGSTVVGTGVVAGDGTFDITTTGVFADGAHTLTATQTGGTSLASAASTPLPVSVDPTAPTLTSVVGTPQTGGKVELEGTGVAGETITLYADGASTAVGSGVVLADGTFDITTSATFLGGEHSFTATQTDSAALTGAASGALQVLVAAPPVLANSGSAPTYAVGGVAVALAPNVDVSDLEAASLQSATVAITGGLAAGDVLAFTATAGITGVYDAADGVLTLTGAASLAAWAQALASVTYASTAADPTQDQTDDTRTVTFTANDGSETSVALPVTITLTQSAGQTVALTSKPTTFNGGAGDDTLIIASGHLNRADVLQGGLGTNVIDLVGGGTFNLATPATLAGFSVVDVTEGQAPGGRPTLSLRSGLDVTVDVASNAVNPGASGITIVGANDSDAIHLGAGIDTVTLGAAAESVYGGAGTDTINATAATAGALLVGGGGHLNVSLTGGGAATLNAGDSAVDLVTLGVTNTAWSFSANGVAGLTILDKGRGADTVTLGANNNFSGGQPGAVTLIESAAGGDAIFEKAAQLNGDTIEGFAVGAGDTIDVTNLNLHALTGTFVENTAGTEGELRYSDGVHTAAIAVFGQFMTAGWSGTAAAAGFVVTSDGGAGTIITHAVLAAPH